MPGEVKARDAARGDGLQRPRAKVGGHGEAIVTYAPRPGASLGHLEDGVRPMKIAVLASLAAFLLLPAHAEERALHKEVVVQAPLADVWNAWTTSEGIKTFFAPDARVEARPDGPFEIYINPYAEPGMKGADGMRFLAVQPMSMLSYTWNAPPSLAEARKQRTLVIVRFAPVSGRETRVTMTHV